MQKSSLITILVILAILLGAGFFVWQSSKDKDNDGFDDSILADNFERVVKQNSFTDLEGNEVSLEQYRGKVLVVNSWASWCPFCVNELPDFSKLAAEYEGRELEVLAINRAESKPQIEAYLRSIDPMPGVTILLDKEDTYYKFIGGFAMPETVFYDTEGGVVVHKRGFMTLDEMKSHVDTLFNSQTDGD
jgi:thiol-disulfide isomerase/thioredoxin